MRQLARIITNCGHRGKVGHIYEIIEKNPRDGFRLVMPGETQFTFWYPAECVEEVEPGACTVPTWAEKVKALDEITTGLNIDKWKVPENADFGWHLDKVTESITQLLKEKNAAYGNTALNPLGIFSKLGASEAIKARIDDKLARIANKGLNDDTEDTARDLVGYLLLLLMSLEREGK
tara:strand:+ start:42 stop:572 length:531 start_codon:yes stop_codon:yes gene_type:complete